MKIIVNHDGEYNDVVNSYYYLENYCDNSEEEVLFQGYNTSLDPILRERYKEYKKRAYLNLESPCAFCNTTTCAKEQSYFTHVFTICPYTANFLNKIQDTKYIPIPFPYNENNFKNINVNHRKIFDVIYMGTLMDKRHCELIDVMRNFKYIHTALFPTFSLYRPTHINIPIEQKWDLLSKSKISVVLNLCPTNPEQIKEIKKNEGWEQNEAFVGLDTNYFPQFKPRVIESMVTKTLVLCKRDQWNVIEKWFEPGKHFLYWDDFSDLKRKIKKIINNFEDYKFITENAHEKVKEYEIKKIFKKIENIK